MKLAATGIILGFMFLSLALFNWLRCVQLPRLIAERPAEKFRHNAVLIFPKRLGPKVSEAGETEYSLASGARIHPRKTRCLAATGRRK
jgi:hypothetical protein